MDPLLMAVVVLVALPLLSCGVVVVFALTADYEPTGIRVRGGSLRGVVAGAIAKVVVGDAKTFQLPLVVSLRKVGILGASTPLVGGATVRDIEWRVFLDGTHVSTVTEASSVRVASRQRELELPVNAEVHLPGGLLDTFRMVREVRGSQREVRIDVKGHVIVRHWLMARELPVRLTQHVLLGPGRPRLDARLRPGDAPGVVAIAAVELHNPYRGSALHGDVEVALLRVRRMRPDKVVARHHGPLDLPPGQGASWRFRVMLAGPATPAARPTALRLRVRWEDATLDAGAAADGDDAIMPDDEVVVSWPAAAPAARLVRVHP